MISQFEQYLLAEKRYSPHTVKAYITDLLQFVDFLCLTPDTFCPSEITSHLVRGWVVELVKSGMSARTVNRKIAALSTFFIYLKRSGAIQKLPTANVIHPKQPKRLPTFVGYEEVNRIPKPDDDDFLNLRNILIVEILYTTGMRRGELVALKIEDLDLQSGSLKVLGKGQKERIIPLIPSTKLLINRYISVRQEYFSECGNTYLFLTSKGEQIYPKLVERVVKELLGEAGVRGKRSPHVLRHTFATHLLDKGADLLSIKELLGHNSIGTTQIYTHNTLQKIKETYMKAHPRADNNS